MTYIAGSATGPANSGPNQRLRRCSPKSELHGAHFGQVLGDPPPDCGPAEEWAKFGKSSAQM